MIPVDNLILLTFSDTKNQETELKKIDADRDEDNVDDERYTAGASGSDYEPEPKYDVIDEGLELALQLAGNINIDTVSCPAYKNPSKQEDN